MKKFMALFLAVIMLASSFASCSESTENSDSGSSDTTQPSAEETVVEEEDEIDSRQKEEDNLPDSDFGGRDYIVIGSEEEGFEKFIDVEEQTGEGVNDAVFNRNITVEDRFNVNIGYHYSGGYGDCSSIIEKCVSSGDSETFQLASFHVVQSGGVAFKGLYMNWYDIPYVDFDRNWWSDSTVEDLSINDHCFIAVGDMALSSIARTYVMLYDKDQMKNYQLEDFYTVVKEGRWTLDYLANVCNNVYLDANGDGTENEGDYFGLATDIYSNLNTYLWACDNNVITKDDEGNPVFSYYSEHLVNAYEACYSLISETQGVYTEANHKAGMRLFSEYGTLTCNAYLDGTISFLSEFENDYGVIPYPKLDESQQDYKTMVDGNHEAMSVAKNIPTSDLEFVGIITEAMCAESYKQVVPAYLDICLKNRYASSPNDAEMMDLCVSARVFDLGYVYDNWKGVSFYFQTLLADDTHPDITSYYEARKKAASKYYEKVFNLFYEE